MLSKGGFTSFFCANQVQFSLKLKLALFGENIPNRFNSLFFNSQKINLQLI